MASQTKTLTFGIVPQQSAKQLAKVWTPVMIHLGEKAGVPVRFVTAKDIPTFEQRLLAGDYDLAYMNPYHYTVFHEKPGYVAFARQANKKIKGLLVVPVNSDISDIQDLAGKTLAFPSPAAFAASVLPRSRLRQEGIAFTPKYVSSHDSVYLSVAKGLFPAGGGIVRTLKNTPENIQKQLRILWTTPGYTPHAFAYHPRVAETDVEKLRQAMLTMHATPEGRTALENLRFDSIETAEDQDWDDVRALNIDLLQHLLVPKEENQ